MDIQVGDRVTYKSINEPSYQARYKIIADENDILKVHNCIKEEQIKILKIERPKYEVVEEKKELLTEEEKEYLSSIINTINKYSGKNIKNLMVSKYTYHDELSFSTDLSVVAEITVQKNFYNLESNKLYTLKELGLEEN